MAKVKTLSFLVTVDVPAGVSIRGMEQYIADAVGVWCKGQDPDRSIFDLDQKSVRVKYHKCPKPKEGG